MKFLIQTIMYPIIWTWYAMSDTTGGIWMPEFPYNTETYIWGFVKKYGYRLDDSTYEFCGILYYHDIECESGK